MNGRELLDLTRVCAAIAPEAPPRMVRALSRLMRSMEPSGSLENRLEWVVQLCAWLRAEGAIELPASAPLTGRSRAARLWLWVEVLRRSPPWRDTASRLFRSLLAETSGLRLFSESGLPLEQGLVGEGLHRLARKLLPSPPDDAELAELLRRMLSSRSEAAWLDELPAPLVAEAMELLLPAADDDPWRPLRQTIADALQLLATRAAALGMEERMRQRGSGVAVRESPFSRLLAACTRAALLIRGSAGAEQLLQARLEVQRELAACRQETRVVLEHLDQYGVSVDLVYRIERIGKQLDRIGALMRCVVREAGEAPGAAALQLVADLTRDMIRDDSLTALVQSNIRQLARKIVERAGETGEHYITSSSAEYHAMIASAAGGGALTAATTVLKFILGWAHLPFFFQGFFASLNYAGSFLLMQGLHLTLATKQPSMTAATLAASLEQSSGDPDLERLVGLIARIMRSQLAAVIGNIGMVLPVALLFDLAFRTVVGHHFLDAETADYVLHSLDPLGSGTVFYAALTGVFLWASSVAAGWVDNWSVYRRLPEAIAQHRRLRRWVGEKRAARIARSFSHALSGIGGNVTLGVLLGMTPMLGKFFGLPLDVRHVTLSSGALALAAMSHGALALLEPAFGWALLGIALTASLNFGVSFALALWVALRAREVNRSERWRLLRLLALEAVRSPLSFIRPPPERNSAPVAQLELRSGAAEPTAADQA